MIASSHLHDCQSALKSVLSHDFQPIKCALNSSKHTYWIYVTLFMQCLRPTSKTSTGCSLKYGVLRYQNDSAVLVLQYVASNVKQSEVATMQTIKSVIKSAWSNAPVSINICRVNHSQSHFDSKQNIYTCLPCTVCFHVMTQHDTIMLLVE